MSLADIHEFPLLELSFFSLVFSSSLAPGGLRFPLGAFPDAEHIQNLAEAQWASIYKETLVVIQILALGKPYVSIEASRQNGFGAHP